LPAMLAGPAVVVDPFGHEGQARCYAAFRPDYPSALLRSIWDRHTGAKALGVDACCGTGKLTVALAAHFDKVLGVDRSSEQLRHADRSAANIEYVEADSTKLAGIEDGVVDLVAIAQALHWMDVHDFCSATKRVLRPGGSLAVLGYGVCSLAAGGAAEAAFKVYYHETLGAHLPLGDPGNLWDCDRRLLDSGFADVEFPFAKVQRKWHFETRRLPLEDFLGYLRTWSAYRKFIAERTDAEDPLEALRAQLVAGGAAESGVDVTFPYFLILARDD